MVSFTVIVDVPVSYSPVSITNRVSIRSSAQVRRARCPNWSETDLADDAHARAESRSGHGLVRPLSAGAHAKRSAEHGLAPRGQAIRAEREVGDECAEDGDGAAAGSSPAKCSERLLLPRVIGLRAALVLVPAKCLAHAIFERSKREPQLGLHPI